MFLLGMLGITTGSCDVLISSVKDMSDYRLYVLCYHAERRGTEEDDECAGATGQKIRVCDQVPKSLPSGIRNRNETVTRNVARCERYETTLALSLKLSRPVRLTLALLLPTPCRDCNTRDG
jgi:hypothetical protein